MKPDHPSPDFSRLGRCLVIGGGGFLGRHLLALLRHHGVPATALGRQPYPALSAAGIPCLTADITDAAGLTAACRGFDTVFHCASLTTMWGNWRLLERVNVEGTAHVVAACRQNGVARLVYTSSPSVVLDTHDIVDGDESLPYPSHYSAGYQRTKQLAEVQVLAANGLPRADGGALRTCALRPHLIWGTDDPHIVPQLLQAARRGVLKVIGAGANQVTLTHVDNAAWGHLLAAAELAANGRAAGQVYFLGDSEPVRLWPWINRVLGFWGLPPVTRRVSWRSARVLATLSCAVHHLLPGLGTPRLTPFIVDQLAHSHTFVSAKARRDLGYTPIVSAEAGLQMLRAQADATIAARTVPAHGSDT